MQLYIKSVLKLSKILICCKPEHKDENTHTNEILVFCALVSGFDCFIEGQTIEVSQSHVPIINAASISLCQNSDM